MKKEEEIRIEQYDPDIPEIGQYFNLHQTPEGRKDDKEPQKEPDKKK